MTDNRRDDHRARLVQAHHELASSFDRGVMTLSAGGLALSIAFVDDIAEDPRGTWLLETAWVFLAASLLLVLGSFVVSQAAFQWEIKQLDKA